MAQQVWLKLSGIPGDVEGAWKEWIPVLTFYHAMARWDEDRFTPPNKDFGVTKHFDAASPLIALACSEGWKIDEGILAVASEEAARPRILEIRLKDVAVFGYQVSGGRHPGDEPPMESLNLRFEKIEWTCFRPEAGKAVRTSWALG